MSQRWIPFMVVIWGVVTVLTSLVRVETSSLASDLFMSLYSAQQAKSFGSLLAIRVCLGICEGGLLPGMVSYRPLELVVLKTSP